MIHSKFKGGLFSTTVVAGVATALLAAIPVHAQQADQTSEAADGDKKEELVTVTGSRIRQDSFSSPTPIQVMDVEQARQIGVSSISELLQRSTVVSGARIDATINTNAGGANATENPPTGGVGSSNINLRGLGPERSLVLVNGRRLGSAGVRGAPAQPDISLLPFSIVDRVEVITEGASSIYGADAVAGVINVILKKDFEGMEFSANYESPEAKGGGIQQISGIMGAVGDKASVMVAAEYFRRSRVTTGNRKFARSLERIEISQNGTVFRTPRSGFFDNVLIDLGGQSPDGRFFYTPGSTNLGVPNFSSGDGLPLSADMVAGLVNDPSRSRNRFPFLDFYNDQDERRAADLVQPIERFSVVSTGQFDTNFWGNGEAYFETYFLNRELFNIAAKEQIFPLIPALIPHENAQGNLILNPDGSLNLVDNPLSPFDDPVIPIYTLDDIPQERNVNLTQFRAVTGFRGDMGNSGWFADKNWTYDFFGSYDRGVGFQSQQILFEPHFDEAIGTVRLDNAGNVICGAASETVFNTSPGCVPFQPFAQSIFTGGPTGEGAFATDAERDYFLGNRTNRTVVEQYVTEGNFTGDLFDIRGGGTVAAAFGGSYRLDQIHSQNDIVGVKGLNAAEDPSQEGETIGHRYIWDIYAETSVPLVVDAPWAQALTVDGAVRYTEEQNFGSEVTYRGRATYVPVEWARLSGSFGTSFRAPNLREQFLADQGGSISGFNDPCLAVNIAAITPPVDPVLLNNCALSGADVNILGNTGVTSIQTVTGGNVALKPETSETITATLAISQPWYDTFDFDFAVSYYDIDIKNSVNQFDAGTILGQCFNSGFDNLSSPFCSLVSRKNTGNPALDVIDKINISFINVGQEKARGLDFNTRLQFDAGDFMGHPLDVSWSTATTYLIRNFVQVLASVPGDDNVGEIGSPRWQSRSTLGLGWQDLQFIWEANYIASTIVGSQQAPSNRDSSTPTAFAASTVFNTTDLTIRKANANSRLYHDVSLTWLKDTYSFTFGVNNLLDKAPPIIDGGFGNQRNNAVTSAGYDLFGRTFFVNATTKF